jgi:leucyl aminopeptidase
MSISFAVSSISPFKLTGRGIVIACEKNTYESVLQSLEPQVPGITQIAVDRNFKGKTGSILVVYVPGAVPTRCVILVGIGEYTNTVISVEKWRRALGLAVRSAEQYRLESLVIQQPDVIFFGVDSAYLAQETTVAVGMAAYAFDQFITNESRRVHRVTHCELVVAEADLTAAQAGVERGVCIVESTNNARDWCNTPPNMHGPQEYAEHARDVAQKYGLTCTIFDEKTIIEMGMGGLAAVSSGSEKECRFVVLEYHTDKKDAPTIALVGKGITFDSGGISIKPAKGMDAMKTDMTGGAVVIATMKALAQLKPTVNIVAIAPFAENMPSGSAYRPSDIIRFYNGKTAEVLNTDAEGRMILADALSYAVKHYKLDAIIDLATLTGACAYALGPFFSGLFSEHDALVDVVKQSADRTGEAVWRLPLVEEYKGAVLSKIADISNTGNERYMAGGTTAACFLQHFVSDVPWVHLDIAGSDYDVPDISYHRPGFSTGVGVRLLIDLITRWEQ